MSPARLHPLRWIVFVLAVTVVGCSGKDAGLLAPSLTPWSQSGIGDTVVTIPSGVSKAKVVADYPGNSSNFILQCPGSLSALFVNELLGTHWGPTHFEGTYLTGGCRQAQISQSSGVSWSVTEAR